MNDNNFGINLTETEKQFINDYCNLISQYGHSTYFPISDELKVKQYNILMDIVSKLTQEEVAKFNEFCTQAEMSLIAKNYEAGNRPR